MSKKLTLEEAKILGIKIHRQSKGLNPQGPMTKFELETIHLLSVKQCHQVGRMLNASIKFDDAKKEKEKERKKQEHIAKKLGKELPLQQDDLNIEDFIKVEKEPTIFRDFHTLLKEEIKHREKPQAKFNPIKISPITLGKFLRYINEPDSLINVSIDLVNAELIHVPHREFKIPNKNHRKFTLTLCYLFSNYNNELVAEEDLGIFKINNLAETINFFQTKALNLNPSLGNSLINFTGRFQYTQNSSNNIKAIFHFKTNSSSCWPLGHLYELHALSILNAIHKYIKPAPGCQSTLKYFRDDEQDFIQMLNQTYFRRTNIFEIWRTVGYNFYASANVLLKDITKGITRSGVNGRYLDWASEL